MDKDPRDYQMEVGDDEPTLSQVIRAAISVIDDGGDVQHVRASLQYVLDRMEDE